MTALYFSRVFSIDELRTGRPLALNNREAVDRQDSLVSPLFPRVFSIDELQNGRPLALNNGEAVDSLVTRLTFRWMGTDRPHDMNIDVHSLLIHCYKRPLYNDQPRSQGPL